MPKTAGSSLLHQFKRQYGEHKILLDYEDDPVNPCSRANLDPNHYDADPINTITPYIVVHGHFHPKKYIRLTNTFRLTFLRHPIENILSIYKYWTANDENSWDSPIYRYYKSSNLSLLRFAMLPKIRYLYTGSYFSGIDMRSFDFIGDYANYDEELIRLGNLLDLPFDIKVRLNVTNNFIKDKPSIENAMTIIEKNEISALEEILKDDIEFYEEYSKWRCQ